MQTCGADPRGVRVEWRDGGGRTRLVGVTELSRMMGTNPNLALLVLEGLVRWEAGRSVGGIKPQRKGWGRLQDRAGDDSSSTTTSTTSSSSSSTSSGGKTPPPKAPKPPPRPPRKDPATSRIATKRRPTPQGQHGKPKAKAKPQAKGNGKPTPPPNPKPPPCEKGAGTPMGMCRVWGTPGMSLGRRGAMGGPSAK